MKNNNNSNFEQEPHNNITIPQKITNQIKYFFNQKNKRIPIIITTLSIITYLTCIFFLTRWYVQNQRNQKFSERLTQELEQITNEEKKNNKNNSKSKKSKYNYKYPSDLSFLNVNLNPYIRINPETVAWIQVNGTNISYPIVQHKDNSYYLNHDFYKRKTDIGAIFADYRDNFIDYNHNNIVYGHNIVNQTMFGQLPRILKKSWQSNSKYHYVKLSTKKNNTIWKVFSVYEISPTTDYLQSTFNSTETYDKFLQTLKNRSSYNFNTKVNKEDKIITLSTCNNIGNKRVVLHAKLISLEKK